MGKSLRVDAVGKTFGGLVALDRVSLEARPGEITAVIGQNGAGKTTLLNVITQVPPPDQGRVFVGSTELTGRAPERVGRLGVVRTFQQLRIFRKLSVLENVLVGFQGNLGDSLLRLCLTPGAVRQQRADHVQKAIEILRQLGLQQVAEAQGQSLSYGLQKLLSLARVMATDAEVVMLDEPTSGLSADFVTAILEVIKTMRTSGKTVVLVEHDMDVVFSVSDRIIVMDQGRVFCEGAPADIRANAEVRAIYFGSRVA